MPQVPRWPGCPSARGSMLCSTCSAARRNRVSPARLGRDLTELRADGQDWQVLAVTVVRGSPAEDVPPIRASAAGRGCMALSCPARCSGGARRPSSPTSNCATWRLVRNYDLARGRAPRQPERERAPPRREGAARLECGVEAHAGSGSRRECRDQHALRRGRRPSPARRSTFGSRAAAPVRAGRTPDGTRFTRASNVCHLPWWGRA